ncbi:MAG: alpha-L-arabinofuranosidase [Phycisphaerae bacterium]|nr:alpha-L-arabinofuranosidase [Phycisphaerae bacterium]
MRLSTGFTLAVLIGTTAAHAADEQIPTARLTVHTDRPGIQVSPMLYGLFFEEINRAGDGGLYAEMIQNRSFEDARGPVAWTLVKGEGGDGRLSLDRSVPLNDRNPTALQLESLSASGSVGAANSGFHGIAVREGKACRLSVYVRGAEGWNGELTAYLENTDGTKTYAESAITGVSGVWKQFSTALQPTATDPAARLVLRVKGPGKVWFDMVSLFPKDTFKARPNGLRADLAQMLADLKPAFVRFPGGCYVEGNKLANAFRWKDSIGDLARRPGHWNLWGYRSTDGLGYHEYLQMCADLGAEPLYVINCGMAHEDFVPLDKMGPWVQDALDAIEYANGGTDTPWGKLRAEAGHPEPFHLKYMQIGNENGGPRYHERYALFYDAIKAKYPQVTLVANEWQGRPTNRPIELLDEHYYNNPRFFLSQADRYDSYDRHSHRIYVGEYAVTQGCGHGNLAAAIGEAAFMTGMERNSDVVAMASYAPLFVNVGWRQWNPDAINFDSARAYGTPSYYVQKLFANHRPDVILATEATAPVTTSKSMVAGCVGVGTWSTQAEFKDIQVRRGDQVLYKSDFSKDTTGWRTLGGKWEVKDNAFRQTSLDTNVRAFAGDRDWTDYTLSLKARKLGGEEGFLISFRSRDENTKSWWNLGGWGNVRHAIEGPDGPVGDSVAGRIETDRWYDIQVEVAGSSAKCYLDGKLIHDVKLGRASKSLYAVAGRTESSREVIIKAVNAAEHPLDTRFELRAAKDGPHSVSLTVLTSADAGDENSLEQPTKVAPKNQAFIVTGPEFRHTLPAHSVHVLRIKAE